MCEYCNIVKHMSEDYELDLDANPMKVYSLLNGLVNNGRLTIYAGDCGFDEWGEVLDSEQHFSVCFYLKCPTCGEIYFFGTCIRGTPKLRVADSADLERIENLVWGRKGEFFEGK